MADTKNKTIVSLSGLEHFWGKVKDFLATNYDAAGAAATAESNAKSYVDGRFTNEVTGKFDAAGAAATAESNAKSYADGLKTEIEGVIAENERVNSETINGLNGRIDVLESAKHTHSNMEELNKIVAGDKDKWDAATVAINDFLTGTDTDKVINKLSDIKAWMEGEGVNATELTEAIAAEAELRATGDTDTLTAAKKYADDNFVKTTDQTVKTVNTAASAGVALTNASGSLAVTVTPGSVAENNASVVTGGAVYSAVEAAKSAVLGSVSETLNSYSTTTQMNDAIDAAKTAVLGSVSDTLKSYSTTTQMNSAIDAAKTEVLGKVYEKSDVYTKTETDTLLEGKADAIYATNSEIEGLFD